LVVGNEVGRLAMRNHPAHVTLPCILRVQGMLPLVTLDLDEVTLLENDQFSRNVYHDTP
jgi:hypothetical protein